MKAAVLALLLFGLSVASAVAAGNDPPSAAAGSVQRTEIGSESPRATSVERAQRRRCRGSRRRNHRRRGFSPSNPRCPRDRSEDAVKITHHDEEIRHVSRGPYPPAGPGEGEDEGDRGQEAKVELPAGPRVNPPRDANEPPPPSDEEFPNDEPQTASPGSARAEASVVGDIQVLRNRSLRASGMPVAPSLPVDEGSETSVATNGRIVLWTSNFDSAISTDGGYSFSELDPETIFPAAAGGFCCDQLVTYIPRRKRFVWVLLYWSGSGGARNDNRPNVVRVATATAAQVRNSRGTRWSFYDFTPRDFGLLTLGNVRGGRGAPYLDRPMIAFSRSHLHITTAVFKPDVPNDQDLGNVYWRIPLGQLGGPIGYGWMRFPREVGRIAPAQGAYTTRRPPSSTQWLAATLSTSRIAVFESSDAANRVEVHEFDVPSIATKQTGSTDPSGAEWLGRWGEPPASVLTGAQAGDKLAFAWQSGRSAKVFLPRGGTKLVPLHDQPAIELVTMTLPRRFGGTLLAWDRIELADLATVLPELRASFNGDLALSYVLGGPTRYASHAVAFVDPWATGITVAGQRTPIDATFSGDYVGLAADPSQPGCFIAAGSQSKRGVAGSVLPDDYIDPHFVLFGRAAAGCKPVFPIFTPFVPPPAPDLLIDAIGGGFGSIRIDVRNAGAAVAGASKTAYSLLGGPDTLLDTPGLAPGEITSLTVPCPQNGNVTVAARADATNLVAEGNETNNGANATVNCRANGPDLVVTDVRIFENDGWFISADVYNNGTTDAGASQTRIAQDGQAPVLLNTPSLIAGDSATVTTSCVSGGLASATATADATNVVTEINEGNNSRSGSAPGTNGRCAYP